MQVLKTKMGHWEKSNFKHFYKSKKTVSKLSNRVAYKRLVWKLTNQLDLSTVKDIDKRAFRKYDLDHKISIYYGFNNNIPAEHIADISNLRIISHKENSNKGVDIFIDKHNSWIICKS